MVRAGDWHGGIAQGMRLCVVQRSQISVSIFHVKMFANAIATFVPIAVPCTFNNQSTVGNFKFWLFGDRNVQGDTCIQGRYLCYIQAFLGWISWGSNIQLATVLYIDPDEATGL